MNLRARVLRCQGKIFASKLEPVCENGQENLGPKVSKMDSSVAHTTTSQGILFMPFLTKYGIKVYEKYGGTGYFVWFIYCHLTNT